MPHGDPNNPQKNPHPVQRYEVIATADAPGSWDSVSATVFFEVTNLACTPEDKFLGVHTKPRDVPLDFEMTRTDERTWKGHFYRDSMLDEDYYGLGVCHWDAIGVTPVFTVHGRTFGAATSFERALAKPQANYFGKGEYLNRELATGGALGFSAVYPEVLKHPEAFFPITVSVREAKP